MRVLMDRVQNKRGTAVLLMLGTLFVLALFLVMRPLRLESPASAGARAMLRLDGALGATVEPVDTALARQNGLSPGGSYLVVTSVASGGPAAAAGIRVGDVIERIGGRPADQMSAGAAPTTPTPISMWRGGQETIVNVRLGSSGRG